MQSTSRHGKIIDIKDSPGTVRLCHLADVHLGYRRFNRLTKSGQNQREADVNAAFKEAVDRIISLKPDIVLIAGDLFHQVRPTNAIISFAFRELKRLAKGIQNPVVISAGNHEYPKRQDTGSALTILSEIEGVYVAADNLECFNFPEKSVSITCLPHGGLLAPELSAPRADDRFRYNVLVTHGQIGKSSLSDFGGAEIDLEQLSRHEWDYIALGHLHEMKEVALNACYSGSLEHTATNIWSDASKNKGFLEIILPSKKIIFHDLSSPREIINLEPLDAKRLDAEEVLAAIEEKLNAVPGGIDGKIIRLEVLDIPREVQLSLNHRRFREIKSRCLNFTVEMRQPLSLALPGASKQRAPRRLSQELEEFCSSLDAPAGQRDKIKQLLLSYLDRVESADEINKSEPQSI